MVKVLMSACVSAVFFAGCMTMKGKVVLPENAVLLDVRGVEDYNKEHIEGAVFMAHDTVGSCIDVVAPCKSTPVYIYCRTGKRAGIALKTLKSMGYENVVNLDGIEDAKARLK